MSRLVSTKVTLVAVTNKHEHTNPVNNNSNTSNSKEKVTFEICSVNKKYPPSPMYEY